jgi:capsular polysaccharide biosynthesis protein
MMSPPPGVGDNGPRQSWLEDEVTAVDDPPVDPTANLVSLGFFAAALRRSAWFWRLFAVVGLLLGSGLYLLAPHTYQASTTLLLTVGPEAQPGTAILEDQALAQSHAMAGFTLHKLGLQQSVSKFLGSYTATPLTDRILLITASAPSSNEAVRQANALATEFLTFRAERLLTEQSLEFATLDQQVAQGKQRVASISRQISQVSAQPASPSQQAKLSALRVQNNRANNDLAVLEQQVTASKAATKVNTGTMIGGSNVLDVASPVVPHSRLKHLLLYAGGGLILGLILGMSIVVVRALLSERLRRRDDVAQALGAPVRSIPATRAGSWLPGKRRRDSDRYSQRVVAYLRDAVPAGRRRATALAVVPVDDPRVAAMSVVSLAASCAQQGKRVIVADLCNGAPAAGLLGAKGSGVHTVNVDGARLVAIVPDPNEFAPVGPLRPTSPRAQPVVAGELAAAWASADLLLTLLTLDPSVGGEHLATWAADAVVVVTAGRSSWTKIHAVGEMIRLAGTRLVSAVLVGADRTDESLGIKRTPGADGDAVTTQALQPDAEGSFAGGPGGRLSDDSAVSGFQIDPPEHLGRRRRIGP